jgi:hypothetical protein
LDSTTDSRSPLVGITMRSLFGLIECLARSSEIIERVALFLWQHWDLPLFLFVAVGRVLVRGSDGDSGLMVCKVPLQSSWRGGL